MAGGFLKQGPSRGIDFLSLLPPPRWSKNPAHRRVRVKSGTMNYADGLVGYLNAQSGRQLGFAILLTDFTRRAALDAAFDIRFAAQPPGAAKWTKRAKKLERALVTSWDESILIRDPHCHFSGGADQENPFHLPVQHHANNVHREFLRQKRKRLLNIIKKMKQLEIVGADCAPFDHCFKINDFVPVLAAV